MNTRFNLVYLGCALFAFISASMIFNIASANTKQRESQMITTNFAAGRVHARIARPLKEGELLVVGIPGGPGIAGDYMDEITNRIAAETHANALVIDLPNHGKSNKISLGSLNYAEVRNSLKQFLAELAQTNAPVVLIGHSMGAYIALDLFRDSPSNVKRVALVSTPAHFNGSERFDEFLKSVNAVDSSWEVESDFTAWWRKVLPAYFKRAPTESELWMLSKSTSWKGNESFLDGISSLREIGSELEKNQKLPKIFLVEGEVETILPTDNKKLVSTALKNTEVHIIENTGHFPMLENEDSLTKKLIPFVTQCGFSDD